MRLFSPLSTRDRTRLVDAIRAAESGTSGEIRVRLQARCSADPLQDAARIFERLGMTATAQRNGVLIFVAWRARRCAIIGDAGIHTRVGEAFWQAAVDAATRHFATSGSLVAGLEAAVQTIGDALKQHFPHRKDDRNELPDTISEG